MKFVVILNKRIRMSSITAFKGVPEVDGRHPYIVVRVRGKQEIMYPKAGFLLKDEMDHLKNVFKDFVQINQWFISKSLVRSYKAYADEKEERFYISFDTSMSSQDSMVIHFKTLEEFRDALNNMDDLFEVI